MKSSENSALDTGSEAPPERTSPLPPPSPTGYEHCFLARCNPDNNPKSAQFTIQTISYVPTGPQSLPLNALVLSSLTQPQRDVLHYILEDRNSRTEEDGCWVLVALLGSGVTSDDERSEDFEISIMFCEYGASADPRFEHNKQIYLSMTTGSDSHKTCGPELRENEENWQKEDMTGTKKNKGKEAVRQEYPPVGQALNSRSLAPAEYGFHEFHRKSKDEPGHDIKPSATLQPPTWLGANSDGGGARNSENSLHSNAQQMIDETVNIPAPSSSPATIQTAESQWKPSPAISENNATPSVLSSAREQHSSQEMEQTKAGQLPTLSPLQLANTHNWANKRRIAKDFRQAILLYGLVWYCRQFLIGPNHSQTRNTIQQLADTYDINGQFGMAANLRQLLSTRNSKSPPDGLYELAPAPITSDLLEIQQWAVKLRRQGVLDRAIWLLTIVWYAWDKLGEAGHGGSRTAMNELALTYDVNGQPDIAKRLRDELAKRRQRKILVV